MSKPQRRKGNAQAASSARAAEWLGASGHNVSFIGFDGGFQSVLDAAESGEPVVDVDDDIKIIYKKLLKKDPYTREKALRELIECVKEKPVEAVDLAFQHFASIFQRLATDGSASVRSLSNRAAGQFIAVLKKSAQKQLKLVVPSMLFSLSDQSAAVCQTADTALEANFPGEKRAQILSVFSDAAASTASDIACGRSEVIAPQKYDDEESDEPSKRENRLVAQALQCLSSLLRGPSPSAGVASAVRCILADTAAVKRLLKMPASVRCSLLTACLLLPDGCAHVVSSPLPQWIVQQLESADAGVAHAAWDALVHLAKQDSFYSSLDAKKAVIPRVLSAIRKKQCHWRVCAPFVLPVVAMLCQHAASDDDRHAFQKALISSFNDNMPFEATGCVPGWSQALSECCKYVLSSDEDRENAAAACVEQVLSAVDVVVREGSADGQESVSRLVEWMGEKAALPLPHLHNLHSTLTMNLVNSRVSSDGFSSRLLSGCAASLSGVHSSLLRSRPLPIALVQCLSTAGDEYLCKVEESAHVLDACLHQSDLSSSDAAAIAPVVWNIIKATQGNHLPAVVHDSSMVRALLECADSAGWERVRGRLDASAVACCLGGLRERADGEAAVRVLFQSGEEQKQLETLLEGCGQRHAAFIASVVGSEKLSVPVSVATRASHIVLDALFASPITKLSEGMASVMRRFPPSESAIRAQRKRWCDESATHQSIAAMSAVASQLLSVSPSFEALLPTAEEVKESMQHLDDMVSLDIVVYTAVVSSAWRVPEGAAMKDCEVEETLARLARSSLFHSLLEMESGEGGETPAVLVPALALSAVTAAVGGLVHRGMRIFCPPIAMMQELTDRVRQMDRFDNSACMRWLASQRERRCALLALSLLKEMPSEWSMSRDEEPSAVAEVLWAIGESSERLRLPTVDRWMSRLHDSSETRESFLSHLMQHVRDQAADWETALFSASSEDEQMWRLNVGVLCACSRLLEDTPPRDLPSDLVDFIMCGLVTAMDSCDERLSSSSLNEWRLRAQAAAALSLFSQCSTIARNEQNEAFDKEWSDFFLPTLSRIVTRWLCSCAPSSGSDAFCRALSECVMWLPAQWVQPGELPSSFAPEWDSFGYAGERQTQLTALLSLINDGNVHMRVAALCAMKRLVGEMYRQENGEWNEDGDKVSSSGPRRVCVPLSIRSVCCDEEAEAWARILLLDVAIQPVIEESLSCQEERVAYCDALSPLVCSVLPALLARCPQDVCIDRSLFSLSLHVSHSPRVLPEYACGVLFRVLSACPALVRQWYAALPKVASQMVNKYIRAHVSPVLTERELARARQVNQQEVAAGENQLKVRTYPATGEIVASYVVEETTMSLSIVLPADWPLAVPAVTLDKSVVQGEKSKKWLLQLTAFLFHQNGAMADGLSLWKRNVDRSVEGAEACCICMSTIHATSHQLPRVRCKQCSNKFHSHCLYKWFESSNQSSCPLCRSNFT